MFHMLTCFDIKPEYNLEEFRQSLSEYTNHMRGLDLVVDYEPIGQRQSDTIMDTDDERDHGFFMLMHFRDRAQCDQAVEYIKSRKEPGASIHEQVYTKVQNPIFICWQDVRES